MSKACEISGKKPMTGNTVSHANNRTKRRFIPNLQNVKLYSGILQKYSNLNITIRTKKTVEKNGGLDSYLIKTSNRNLAEKAIKIKKQILKNWKEGYTIQQERAKLPQPPKEPREPKSFKPQFPRSQKLA